MDYLPFLVLALLAAYLIAHFFNLGKNRQISVSGYIHRQNEAPAKLFRYGFYGTGHSGCGWVSVHNVNVMLGRAIHPSKIISALEWIEAFCLGFVGTVPFALRAYFFFRGDRTRFTRNMDKVDALAKEQTASILGYLHRKGGHFAAIRWDGENFWGYNMFSDGTGPYCMGPSISAFMTQRGYLHPQLVVVHPKKEKKA